MSFFISYLNKYLYINILQIIRYEGVLKMHGNIYSGSLKNYNNNNESVNWFSFSKKRQAPH